MRLGLSAYSFQTLFLRRRGVSWLITSGIGCSAGSSSPLQTRRAIFSSTEAVSEAVLEMDGAKEGKKASKKEGSGLKEVSVGV